MICLLIQPIHPAGVDLLKGFGLDVRQASASTMDVVAREIVGAGAAITRNAGLNRAAFEAAVNLRVLGNHGIGVDPVDVPYATEIGVPIVFTPYANVQSVAEHAVTQMLTIAKRIRESDRAVRAGEFDYRYARDFHELTGKTLGILGFGVIGRRTAEMAKAAFGMRVVVYDPYVDAAVVAAAGMERIDSLDEMLGMSDVVSVHLRLTPETRGILDRARLGRMKKGAILVNTGRGATVDTEALVWAVQSGHLKGAGMDVFDKEPVTQDHPFTKVDGILLTPHIAGSTEEALERTAVETAQQVIDVLAGKRPPHLVNPDVWDRRRQ
jgi:D-3-phosphoglycerate dehydrogenase